MGKHAAFFYGTLMSPQVLYRVLWQTTKPSKSRQDRLTIVPAILHSYCRHKVYMCDYPGIIPQENKAVQGVYVTGLDDRNMLNLDAFEGSQYRRDKVKVQLLDKSGRSEGQPLVDAETYVFLDKHDLVNEEWSYEEFVREKIHRWIYSGEEYDEVDKVSVLNGHDPTGGRSTNGEMDTKLFDYEMEKVTETGKALSNKEFEKAMASENNLSGEEMEEVYEERGLPDEGRRSQLGMTMDFGAI